MMTKRKPAAETGSDPTEVGATIHELRPPAMSRDQEREALYLCTLAELRGRRAATTKAKAAFDAVKLLEKQARALAEAAGFRLSFIDEIFKREGMARKTVAADEQERQWHMEKAGQPLAVQQDMFDRMPEGARDEEFWKDHGYAAGLAGKPGKPPAEMAPQFVQVWLQRWGAGQDKLSWALAEKGINSERTRTDIAAQPLAKGPEDEEEEEGEEDEAALCPEEMEMV